MEKGLIIDIEGTLLSSGKPLPGAIEFINYLNKQNINYHLVTNTVSKTVEKWELILNEIGLKINKNKIIYPLLAINDYLNANNIKTYYFLGPENMEKILKKTLEYNIPEYIIFCDFENIILDYELFNKLFQYINNGAKIITTSYSDYYISNNEYKMDTGIFVKMYEILTNKNAIIIGKPSQIIYSIALKRMGMEANNVISIGDDGLTDIIGGNEMGMETVMVKTGKYKNGDEEKYKPKKVINNIMEIIREI